MAWYGNKFTCRTPRIEAARRTTPSTSPGASLTPGTSGMRTQMLSWICPKAQVLEDRAIGNARVAAVAIVGQRLHVVEEQIGIGGRGQQVRLRHVARRIDGRMDLALAAEFEQRQEKAGLHERFAAGERDAAAGAFVEHAVTDDRGQHFGHAHVAADEAAGLGRTRLGARPAARTLEHFALAALLGEDVGTLDRTFLPTAAAGNAAGGVTEDFRLGANPFRIVAPLAPQRAALEEDDRADSRSVVQRVDAGY